MGEIGIFRVNKRPTIRGLAFLFTPLLLVWPHMLDIRFVRQNPDIVRDALKGKKVEFDLDSFLALDSSRLEKLTLVENLRAEQNQVSEKIPTLSDATEREQVIAQMKLLKEDMKKQEEELAALTSEWESLFKKIPNIPLSDVPFGQSEEDNEEVSVWGEKPEFSFTPRNHVEIAELHGWIDKERAAKVSGARFAYLMGDMVRLQFALINWIMDVVTNEETLKKIADEAGLSVSTKPFLPILPPYLIKTGPYDAMDRLEPRDDRYKIEGEDLWLQGSAEHVLGSMHADEIFQESELPVRYIGYATSFRKEAGTYGKDMEGIIRMHQFDKLEMECFTTPEDGINEHLFLIAIQEYLLRQLKLPYHKLMKCTYDIGKPNARGVDMEVWFPSQNKYRETHTADYMTDYQARRLQTRFRSGDSVQLIHTNDATALALGRGMIAVVENYQQSDGTINIPDVLVPYVGKTAFIPKKKNE